MSPDHWRLRWPKSTLPMPSAISLLAVPARMGVWERQDLAALLEQELGVHSTPYLGWRALSQRPAITNLATCLNERRGVVRFAADLWRWWPPCLRALLGHRDPTTYARLRFCEACMRRGDHSPLFQLPWWRGCPVHAGELREGCPECGAAIPAGFRPAAPSSWLTCSRCGHDLCDQALLAHLHDEPSRQNNDLWWHVIGAYRGWLSATQQTDWAPEWMVHGDGTGTFENLAELAVRHLLRLVPATSPLKPHLDSPLHGGTPAEGVWSRSFVERLQSPQVKTLGFASRQQMRLACSHYYGALPINEGCRRILAACHRHLLRRLKIRVLGPGAPNGCQGSIVYRWRGPRPLPVVAFRLLTGLVQADRVKRVAYLDFRAVGLLLEPPVYLAQRIFALWTGVDLEDLRTWPRDLQRLVSNPAWLARTHPQASTRDLGPVPMQSLNWLYDRLIVESWRDVANECFSRAHPDGVIAWAALYAVDPRFPPPERLVFHTEPLRIVANEEEAQHPLLVGARHIQRRPRSWAAAVLQTSRAGTTPTYVALVGRATQEPFAPALESSFKAQWTWPEEFPPENTSSDPADSTPVCLVP